MSLRRSLPPRTEVPTAAAREIMRNKTGSALPLPVSTVPAQGGWQISNLLVSGMGWEWREGVGDKGKCGATSETLRTEPGTLLDKRILRDQGPPSLLCTLATKPSDPEAKSDIILPLNQKEASLRKFLTPSVHPKRCLTPPACYLRVTPLELQPQCPQRGTGAGRF